MTTPIITQLPDPIECEERTLAAVIALMMQAIAALEAADRLWTHRASVPPATPEALELNERLHVATHEEASSLGFALQDIRALAAGGKLRQRYPTLSPAQFDQVAACGWSLALVQSLHVQQPNVPLAALSTLMKDLVADWWRLPRSTRASLIRFRPGLAPMPDTPSSLP